jgi:hypothetical protein
VPFSSIHVASARSDVLSARLAEVEFICEVAYPKATIGERLVVAEKSLKRSMARPDETSLAFYPGRLNAVRSIAAC